MITCCKNCNKRKVGCHGVCEDYIAFKSEHDAELERINNEKENFYLVGRYKADVKRKAALLELKRKRR